ncbi:unnamed protein product [Brassica napus]|uniref:(rape) hypothetical protein n=1 Tax=Brassica napus TaxID=3708 RepID=A0A816TQY0_BRANA|nr:unnamed protein product [Brassica napus]
MKNVAKCDTWCELQNPVNHRVFERKLRPKPSGRGHVCLGVTNRRPPSSRGYGTEADLPCVIARVRRPVQKPLMAQSPQRDPSLEKRPQRRTGPKFPGKGHREGESPVVFGPCRTTRRCLRVGLFGECSPNRAVNSVQG